MDCRSCIDRLDGYLEGQLGQRERLAVEEHLTRCPRCRELHTALEASAGASVEPPPDLLGAVLSRTSGSTCESARQRLCDHVDAALEAIDAELVRSHLDGCEDCAALSSVLGRLGEDLPLLAELRPDERFVDDVLRRTLPDRWRAAGWTGRLAEVWQSLVGRPRFALEAAYVGTLILAFVFVTPGSPLAGVPRRVIELTRINPLEELREPAARLESQLSSGAESVWQSTGARMIDASREAASSVAELSAATVDRLNDDLGTLWERVASEQQDDATEPTTLEQESTQGD
jgi:predicted anti-sigma-YlaC factor YlaD